LLRGNRLEFAQTVRKGINRLDIVLSIALNAFAIAKLREKQGGANLTVLRIVNEFLDGESGIATKQLPLSVDNMLILGLKSSWFMVKNALASAVQKPTLRS
jgi:hypothetical protein